MSNPVFLCPDLSGDRVVVDGPEGRHAATVRRIRVGEVLDLVDGVGTRCTGTVVAATKDSLTVDVLERAVEAAPAPRITLVQALAKGDRGELAVELATEVGIDTVVPWAAARCIVSWSGERGAKALDRWRSTAREAGKQSRRAWFPVVTEPLRTAEVAALSGQLLVLHEEAVERLSAVDLDGDVVLVVGPEGGIAPEELAVLVAAGGRAVRLGASVLRTSTAGAAAAAVVSARTGRW
ncbi:MAG: rRNA ((1498)-N(3))-methyltransferase [Frankiales bacterium]|nr:rRNA ((1498)-N(3))-methyltransferase [Frankiales bacterium]